MAIASPAVNLILFGLLMVIAWLIIIAMPTPLSLRLTLILAFLAYINQKLVDIQMKIYSRLRFPQCDAILKSEVS
ncbi:MAG TPA: hypothetical protein DD761_06865 [Cyanobacteria bacterium UBA11691]|nr:hypothetical protein [Cyanobacteria bacterium UBA11691]